MLVLDLTFDLGKSQTREDAPQFRSMSTNVCNVRLLWKMLDTLTLILLTWRIWWAANNASRWQMGFNSVFKELSTDKNDLVTW